MICKINIDIIYRSYFKIVKAPSCLKTSLKPKTATRIYFQVCYSLIHYGMVVCSMTFNSDLHKILVQYYSLCLMSVQTCHTCFWINTSIWAGLECNYMLKADKLRVCECNTYYNINYWPIDRPPSCPGLHDLRIACLNTYYNMKAISLHYNITDQLSD